MLWARQLGTVVGATTQAITTVVAVFMAGLALGGLTGARVAPHLRQPLATYGLTELAIGVAALLVSLLLPALEGLTSLTARYLAATVSLLVVSGLMGMTYPLVVEAYGRTGRGGGPLYALNTAGAAVGCLLAGFAGIGLAGVRTTALVAAGLNLMCGAGALALARRVAPAPRQVRGRRRHAGTSRTGAADRLRLRRGRAGGRDPVDAGAHPLPQLQHLRVHRHPDRVPAGAGRRLRRRLPHGGAAVPARGGGPRC